MVYIVGQVIQGQLGSKSLIHPSIHDLMSQNSSNSTLKDKENSSLGLLYTFLKHTIERKEVIIKRTKDQLETAQRDLHSFELKNTLNLQNEECKENAQKLLPHMDDLESTYYGFASKQITLQSDLNDFSCNLSSMIKYTKLQTLATLYYADNFFNFSSSIVSSMEFDKDDEFFATAGVTKKIRIYAYADVVRDYRNWRSNFITPRTSVIVSNDLEEDGVVQNEISENEQDSVPRYPLLDISCPSKISCLSWNSQMKSYLASADYEGCISLWDTNTGSMVTQFDEHEKRAWSVDFCESDPFRLASGGDDSKGNFTISF